MTLATYLIIESTTTNITINNLTVELPPSLSSYDQGRAYWSKTYLSSLHISQFQQKKKNKQTFSNNNNYFVKTESRLPSKKYPSRSESMLMQHCLTLSLKLSSTTFWFLTLRSSTSIFMFWKNSQFTRC